MSKETTRDPPGKGARPIAAILLRAYKWPLSPLFMAFGVRCRHLPSCSEYAAGAVSRHGPWTGGWLALSRVLRCHPFGSEGYDPVPEIPPTAPWYAPWRLGDWDRSVRPFPEAEDPDAQTVPIAKAMD